jgi:FMN phosphatase YigB (HAD superfamily)
MATLPLIVFDVDETLLDLQTMEPTDLLKQDVRRMSPLRGD